MNYYSIEENVQILVALLKKHGIRKVIASPGTTNLAFVACLQHDNWFQIYSSVDERSAAYIACGIATESNEPVVITCTEATASRNYMPGLTEAYYRKLPILAVTGYRGGWSIGNLVAQSIDRSVVSKDIALFSVALPPINNEEERWLCCLNVNKALLELKRKGGGPVHINLCTTYSRDFSVKSLPNVKAICRISQNDDLPSITDKKKIAILIGSHRKWSQRENILLDEFCEKTGAVVFYDHTSSYKGKHGVLISLIGAQEELNMERYSPDLLIHLGEITGGVFLINPKEVWRVSEDGELRDRFRKLSYVFEMTEENFLEKYCEQLKDIIGSKEYYILMKSEYESYYNMIPELPFSNIWIAKTSVSLIPRNSFIYFGILHTLRSWNFFEMAKEIDSISNVGGFGIDGGISTLFGASLVNRGKIHFCIIGDLSFFYDMNVLGNRHMQNNVRIMLINNGRGTEFRNYGHIGSIFGEDADAFIAAAGHFGDKSPVLVKHFAEDLGFEYLTANDKESYLANTTTFFDDKMREKPIIFEVFMESNNESKALELLRNLYVNNNKSASMKKCAKKCAKKLLGESTVNYIKQFRK